MEMAVMKMVKSMVEKVMRSSTMRIVELVFRGHVHVTLECSSFHSLTQ